MIGARRVADAEIGAEKSGSEFPDKLLDRVGVIAETLAELPIAAALDARPVRQLMKLGRVVGLGGGAGWRASEGLARRQMNLVGRATIEGAASTVMDDSASCGDKSLGAFDRLDGVGGRLGQGRGGIAFDLLGGKDGRCARKKAGACLVLAALVGGDGDLFVEDDMRGLLALADLRAGFAPLLVGAPGAGLVALGVAGSPKGQDVHAATGLLRRDIGRPHDVAGGPVPGQAEFAGSGLDRGDDLVGDLLMDVKALFLHCFSPPWGLVAAAAATLPVGETGEGRGQAKSMRVVRAHKRSAEPRPCRFCLRGGRGSAPRLPLTAAGRPRTRRQGWKPDRAETACGFGSRQPGRASAG